MLSESAAGEETVLREYADRMLEAERIAHFGVFRWEIATGRVRWSDELHRIYGLEPGEFEGTVDAFVAFLHPDDRDRVWENIERSVARREPFVFEERIMRKDSQERVLLSRGCPVTGADGEVAAVVGVCHDITERVQAERALGLSERRIRAILDYTPSIVAVKDLDGRYLMSNAETGRVLGMTADQIVGRYCTDLFPTIAERLRVADRQAAAEMEPVYDEVVLVRDGEKREYVTVTFALPDEDGRPIETCTIGTDVTERFLPAAERYGLIQSIDTWMVARALELARSETPAVNLSAVTLCDPEARGEIVRLLSRSPTRASRLIFEITETADAATLDAACEFAEELTTLGCGLALDDFGVGFGSFTYLRTLPLRYLKIDRSFVRDVVRSRDDRRVVQSIVGIARQFDLKVVAEGIEDAPTLELVREMGIDYGQGFHLGRPAPASG